MFRIRERAEKVIHNRLRKTERVRSKERKALNRQWRQELVQYENKAIRLKLKTAHRNMVEDWRLGPLRPNRSVGKMQEKYGALPKEFLQKPRLPNHLKIPAEKVPFRKGDRVVILVGPERGKIGIVDSYTRETNEVTVKDMNMAWVDGDMFGSVAGSSERIKQSSIPYNHTDVKLVMCWEDPRDKRRKDVIVQDIEFRKVSPGDRERTHIDPWTGKQRYDRYVQGTNIKISMSDEELKKERDPERREHEDDTPIQNVQSDDMFDYTLLGRPVPDDITDELRNKYSKVRMRHDDEWVERKEKEDEERLAKLRIPEHLKTPTQVLRELRQKQKKEEEKANPKILTDEVLARIGQMVLKNAPDAPVSYKKVPKVRLIA